MKNYPRDNVAIKKLVEETRVWEKRAALFLGNLFLTAGCNFTEVVSGNSYKGEKDRYDLDVFLNNRKDQFKKLLKIECEVGLKQYDWKETLPPRWFCLSLLERKDYIESDVFIKHNTHMSSLFAVDCDWFQTQIKSGAIKSRARNHNLGIVTSDNFYELPIEETDHVIICENNEFDKLFKFLIKRMNKVKSINKYD